MYTNHCNQHEGDTTAIWTKNEKLEYSGAENNTVFLNPDLKWKKKTQPSMAV